MCLANNDCVIGSYKNLKNIFKSCFILYSFPPYSSKKIILCSFGFKFIKTNSPGVSIKIKHNLFCQPNYNNCKRAPRYLRLEIQSYIVKAALSHEILGLN